MEAKPDAIIFKAEGSNVAGLYSEVRSYLQPLHGLLGFEAKDNTLKTTGHIHGLAKRYVPFLGRLLKVSCNNLTNGISTSEMEQKRADELFKTLKLALDCFDALRPCLVGSPHEIEVQRYWMVRRLMAWKRFTEAREECWVTLHNLKENVFCKEEKGKKEVVASTRKGSARKKEVGASSVTKKDVTAFARKIKEIENDKDGVNLYGEQAGGADSGLVGLVVGLVTDLVICTGESKLKEAEEYLKVLVLIDQLAPWQRVSDKNTIEKHRSMLFKGLHKCSLFMAIEPSYFDPKLTRTFGLLALDNCSCSSVKDQFLKVTCGICHQLVLGGPNLSSIVVDICKFSLSTIFKDAQQWQIYGENEIIDVVEFYCHHCESNSKLRKDAKQFLHVIANTSRNGSSLLLPAVLHIYAIAMGFKDMEVSDLCNDRVIYIDCEILKEKSCAENIDTVLLSNLVQMFQNMVEEVQKTSEDSKFAKHGYKVTPCSIKSNALELGNRDHIQTGRSLITIFRALEFLWKVSARCIQQEWDLFVANTIQTGPSGWVSSLEQAFLLFSRVFVALLGFKFVTLEEKKELRRCCHTVLLAATAALRLSLIRFECSQESFEIISNLISRGWVRGQELKWLISCTYNVGVRMFNNKKFILACNPLKLAHRAAWRRISFVLSGSSDGYVECECGTGSCESISELVSDACVKSVALVDVLHRSGSLEAREIITDFLREWSSADPRLSSSSSRHALVKHWVKLVFADCKDTDMDEASVEGLTLYKFLTDSCCLLPVETLGILLEEELLAYTNIETELSRLVQKRIIKFLLEDVYVTKEYSLERARVLLEQCKAVRLIGAEGLDRCMDCLSNAILLLRKDLDENYRLPGKSYYIDSLRHQLAITYCVHAFCTQELNANSEVIRDDIGSALKLWSCIYSSEWLDLNEEQKDWLFDSSIPLLLNMSQLLALKGFICLQSEVQEMILHILSALKKMDLEESCALLWRESSLNHTLCCIPFSANILSTLADKAGVVINSKKFWENSLSDHFGSLLEFQQKMMHDMFIEAQADRDLATNSSLNAVSTMELLKERAVTLASNGQKTIQSAFVASNLLYILSEKYRRHGKLSEALKYSKEALLIRRKQFQRSLKLLEKKAIRFACNNDDAHKQNSNEMEGVSLEFLGSVATNSWSKFSDNRKQQECGMSQWIVLGNYLESLMQVGVVYEMVGAANEAEYIFLEGLNISNAQDLPLGQAAFGSCLGEIYRKRHKWDIAEQKFHNAMQVFSHPDVKHVCKLCRVSIEATLEMRIGDFVRRCPKERKHVNLYKDLTSAVEIYMAAKENLHNIARTYSDDMPTSRNMHIVEGCGSNSHASEEVNAESSSNLGSFSIIPRNKIFPLALDSMLSEDEFSQDVAELCKEMRKSFLGEPVINASNDIYENIGAGQRAKVSSRSVDLDESSIGIINQLKGSESACKRTQFLSKFTSYKQTQNRQTASFDASRNGSRELSHWKECGDPFVTIKDKTESMQELIAFTLEFHRRSLMSRLLLQIGKCHVESREFLKAHEIILQNISLLFFHNDELPCLCSFINGHHCQQKCPGRRIPVDMLLIERAALLYHISWFSLKKNLPALSWTQCGSFSENQRSFVIGWLHHAFFICSQMPALLQKVSMLLAIVHMPLALGGLFLVPEEHVSNLSASHWSAYFHQVSLGTTLRQEHLAVLDAKLASCDSDTDKVYRHLNSRDLIERIQQVLRLIPDNLDCLEPVVVDFFKTLPLPTVVCISLLDHRYASILVEQAFNNSSSAWCFLTRFNSNGPPVVLLLPIHSTSEGTRKNALEGDNLCSPCTVMNLEADDLEINNLSSISEVNKWTDSSSQMVMDVVAGEFGLVLEESRLSTSNALPTASNEDKNRWWQWRMQLDKRLGNLLRGIEDSWLGPWKCLLLGEPSEAAYRDALQTHMQDLKSMIDSTAQNIEKEPVDAGLLKALLGGVPSLTSNEIEKGIYCLMRWKNFKHLHSPSLAHITSIDCSPKQNEKKSIQDSFLSHSIHEVSEGQDIIGKAAKELTNTFQNAALRNNGYYKMRDKEPKKSSRKKKKQFKEDSTECRSSESYFPCNLSNDLENSSMTCIQREPVVLVLDANSQVLPWESLPILRKQEVYRMPSVGSISALMISRGYGEIVDLFDEKQEKMSKGKNNTKQEIFARKKVRYVALEQTPKLPVVDPCNAFYLLNPSGDLSTTQAAFEDWFKNQQDWEGKAGVIPTLEECIFALQKHDLFIYFGHGSGEQYIPERNIKMLDYCAAALLMGCSSGRLSCRGDYEPVGVPLSYLMAGCPSIIANLWDVTDGDIDRFSKVLLHSWLEAKSGHCSDLEVLEEFQNLTISGHNSGRKVLRPRQRGKDDKDKCQQFQLSLSESSLDKSIGIKSTRGAIRTGSCIGKGRSTCKLPYLIGAAPVCYGVPTTIKHK